MAAHAESLEALFADAKGLNATLPVPLADTEVKVVCQSAWKYKQQGRLFVGRAPFVMMEVDEINRFDANAFYLLAYLRQGSGHRRNFAIGQEAVKKVLRWSKKRLTNTLKDLIAAGVLHLVKQGGKTKGDCSLYAWGAKPTSI